MPYQIKKMGNRYCVVKPSGEVVKCHPTEAAAKKHLKALYANVKDAKK
jgi:hypothetical protein